MSNIQNAVQEYKEDARAIHDFCDEIYRSQFSDHFVEVRELYKRLKSKIHPISDDELEYILTTFPLELFSVAEGLNSLRLDYEVVKLKNKEKIEELRKELFEASQSLEMTKAEKQEFISHSLNEKMVEYEILLSAYSSVITRVENEQSFSRELIMGAKKIWDSRRSSEQSNPVGNVAGDDHIDLPEYDRKQYIK